MKNCLSVTEGDIIREGPLFDVLLDYWKSGNTFFGTPFRKSLFFQPRKPVFQADYIVGMSYIGNQPCCVLPKTDICHLSFLTDNDNFLNRFLYTERKESEIAEVPDILYELYQNLTRLSFQKENEAGYGKKFSQEEENVREIARFMSSTEAGIYTRRKYETFYGHPAKGNQVDRSVLEKFSRSRKMRHTANAVFSFALPRGHVYPFSVDMTKLFEAYVFKLLGKITDNILSQRQFERNGNRDAYRPDYLLPDFNLIIDAKYKPGMNGSADWDDIKQMCGYLHSGQIRSLFKTGREPVAIIVYPDSEASVTEISASLLHHPETLPGDSDFLGIRYLAVKIK